MATLMNLDEVLTGKRLYFSRQACKHHFNIDVTEVVLYMLDGIEFIFSDTEENLIEHFLINATHSLRLRNKQGLIAYSWEDVYLEDNQYYVLKEIAKSIIVYLNKKIILPEELFHCEICLVKSKTQSKTLQLYLEDRLIMDIKPIVFLNKRDKHESILSLSRDYRTY